MSIVKYAVRILLLFTVFTPLWAESSASTSFDDLCTSVQGRILERPPLFPFAENRLSKIDYNIVINPPYPWVMDTTVGGFFKLSIPNEQVTAYVEAVDFEKVDKGNIFNSFMAKFYSQSYLFWYLNDARHSFESYIYITSTHDYDTVFNIEGKELTYGFGGLMLIVDESYPLTNFLHYQFLGGTSHVTGVYATLASFSKHEENIYNLIKSIDFHHATRLLASSDTDRTSEKIRISEDKLYISPVDGEAITITLFDLQGRMLKELFNSDVSEESVITLPDNLGSGLKLLSIEGENFHEWKKIMQK